MKPSLKYGLSVYLIATISYSCSKDVEIATYYTSSSDKLEIQLVEHYGSLSKLTLPGGTSYSEIPADSNNPLTQEKVALGKQLFHETGLALNPEKEVGRNTYSCASCHHAKAGFQSGILQGIGEGGSGFGLKGESRIISPDYEGNTIDVQPIRSPSILNTAYQKVMLWNGQFGATGPNVGTEANWTVDTPKETNTLGFEGLETQAIAGLTVHRLIIDIPFITANGYKELFDEAFPNIQENERYTKLNAGLAIAAYERTVLANNAPFQKWLQGDETAMNDAEIEGASLFFGKGNCNSCHSGPGLNGMEFHSLGMNDFTSNQVHGEIDEATKKGRGGFTLDPNDDYKFKTPTLYNLKDVKFLGHGGSFTSVKEVIDYKNGADQENANVPEEKLSLLFTPLGLSDEEIEQLTAFVENALYDNDLDRYVPSVLTSGNCFPNADEASKNDMGCN